MTEADARPRSADTRARILEAARNQFGRHGYDRATIRAIAAEAQIDPSLVMRYFGSKEHLFTVAAEFQLRLPEIAALPADEIGAAVVGHFVERWDHDDTLLALLRRAATDSDAAERMRQIFATQLVPHAVAISASTSEGERRAGLAATQILGMALCRYVLRLPPVVAMDKDEIVAWLGPTLQRYFTESSVR